MATFLLGDCLEMMKSLPDKSVDCFICDLPYGCLTGGGGQEKAKRKKTGEGVIAGCEWDVKIDLEKFWVQIKRLCKDDHTPVLMFCNTKFGIDLINSNPKWYRYDLVWAKTNAVGFLLANSRPMTSHEMIYVFSKKGANYKRINYTDERCPTSVVTAVNKKCKGQHPTAKPEELYKWLLSRYCPADGTVLDPTAGSFNACFVAREMGLKAIGIEKDRTYFYKAVSKLIC